ncbi:MEDS domain-containing protein [Mesobacillus harenae]|uniref:MEDS domain-containing protein n=1 Tax=Mesobacillus harenae TaxID=2213203 RepID=UPI0015810FB0|nr:MEDS domain-containing protein [Mesobacillus harenae]
MDKKIQELINNLSSSYSRHIFYHYDVQESYIKNAVSYILLGIRQGNHIVLVENERNYRMIIKDLENLLTKEQLTLLHHINNFDFYYSTRNFHPHAVINNISETIEPYFGISEKVRTWGHIEWGDLEEVSCSIEEYEQEADKKITETGLISVCAYNAKRITPFLKGLLMKCHGIMMTDDEIIDLSAK